MNYWLFKSDPRTFSINDLSLRQDKTCSWDGIRQYEVRNYMRQMKGGDQAFFYHSKSRNPMKAGIVGMVEIIREAYLDSRAFDPEDPQYDPHSNPYSPCWFAVDLKLIKKFLRIITLTELKANAALQNMVIFRPGNQLSVTPVTSEEAAAIIKTRYSIDKNFSIKI